MCPSWRSGSGCKACTARCATCTAWWWRMRIMPRRRAVSARSTMACGCCATAMWRAISRTIRRWWNCWRRTSRYLRSGRYWIAVSTTRWRSPTFRSCAASWRRPMRVRWSWAMVRGSNATCCCCPPDMSCISGGSSTFAALVEGRWRMRSIRIPSPMKACWSPTFPTSYSWARPIVIWSPTMLSWASSRSITSSNCCNGW